MHELLLHNTFSAGRALSEGDRGMWYMQAAVMSISQRAKGLEKYQIDISFLKWSC